MKLFSIVLLAILASCSTQEQKILLVLKTVDNPFFVDMEKGVKDELSKAGLKIELVTKSGQNEGDVGGQRIVLDSQFDQNVANRAQPLIKALILTPASSGADLVQSIRRYRDANIPVILLDTEISKHALESAKTEYNLVVFTDNIEGGRLAAEKMVSLHAGAPCNILILNGVADSNTARERREGFVERAQSLGCEIGLEKTANWRREQAQQIVGVLAGSWNFTGVFAANDEMALGAFSALRQSGRDTSKIPIVGFDATDEARRACNEGRLAATVAQDPFEMGRRAIRAAVSFSRQTPIPKFEVQKLAPKVVCG